MGHLVFSVPHHTSIMILTLTRYPLKDHKAPEGDSPAKEKEKRIRVIRFTSSSFKFKLKTCNNAVVLKDVSPIENERRT